MNEPKPKQKTIIYDVLSAEITYDEHVMVLTNTVTGETISIPAIAYPELQSIMTDIGRQIQNTRAKG